MARQFLNILGCDIAVFNEKVDEGDSCAVEVCFALGGEMLKK